MVAMPKPPFHSFAFTLIENKRPRQSLRLMAAEDDLYELKVQKGSAANPSSQFTRKIPLEVVERFRDALQGIGVFNWEESYGDATAPGTRRWTVSTVFQEGVFSVESKGGSDVPQGFDELLEELYRLDFPRPAGGQPAEGQSAEGRAAGLGMRPGLGGMSIGDLGAYASAGQAGVDFSQMADIFKDSGLPGMDAGDMQRLLADAQNNPQLMQQRMKEEFRHLSPEEQSRMLDALAATGLATREWWERFFRS